MGVRAKFTVNSVTPQTNATQVQLYPVTSGSEENDRFFAATPSGSISMLIKNEQAASQFKQGQTYYVDFTPA